MNDETARGMPYRLRAALLACLLAGGLAGCDSHGGMDGFSVYGVQVIANSSDTIPPGMQQELKFEAYRSGRYIFKVQSSGQGNLVVRLASAEQHERGRKNEQLHSAGGSSVQFERNLAGGIYYLIIDNRGRAADRVSYNITAAEN